MSECVKLIECPRDAWQGLKKQIPTEVKVNYLRGLIAAGFRHLDAVSFVSPKYVPQMADSEEVMQGVLEAGRGGTETQNSKGETRNSKLENPPDGSSFEFLVSNFGSPFSTSAPEIIGIVVNEKGLERALAAPGVTTVGYPYSISAHFRRQNTNMSLAESRALVEELQHSTQAAKRRLVVYISMAFGNAWDEPWGPEIVADALEWLKSIGVRTVSLADTVGTAEPQEVADLYKEVKSVADAIELGVHLHSRPDGAAEKVLAAFEAGCRRFDSALTGLGGCPFAGDELVGNIPTETVAATLAARGVTVGIESAAIESAVEATRQIRREYT